MRNKFTLILTILVIFSGCSNNEDTTLNDNVKIANPASQYCIDQGFNSTIKINSDDSQTGYCVFPNGNECEEWKFMRGECKNE